MKKIILTLVGVGLCLGSCSSDDDAVEISVCPPPIEYMAYPEVTTEGRATLAFKMGAREFISCLSSQCLPVESKITAESPIQPIYRMRYYLEAYTQQYVLRIIANNQRNYLDSFVLEYRSVNPIKEGDKFAFSKNQEDGVVFAIYNSSVEKSRYGCIEGEIEIVKLDTENKIMSGIFNFKAEDQNNRENIITATEGRFDILYRPM